MMDNNKVIDKLKTLLKGRVDSFEIFVFRTKGTTIEVKEQEVESSEVYKTFGIGLRVLKDMCPGFFFSSTPSYETLRKMVDDVIFQTEHSVRDELLSFPEYKAQKAGELNTFDPSLASITVEEKIKTALALEDAALSYDPRVKKVRGASYSEMVQEIELHNSVGNDLQSLSTRVSAGLMAVAEDGKDSQMGWDSSTKRGLKDIDVVEVGRRAAEKAVGLLRARTIKSMKVPILLDNTIVVQLLGVLSSSFLGDSVQKGKSMLQDKVGEKVFSSKINILDNGILTSGWSTAPFDGEGVPTQKTSLVKEGVCSSFLYDTYWAKRAGVSSTGNCRRLSFKTPPTVAVSNLYIEKGETPFSELLKGINKGLYITEVMGVHTANPVTGDFSLGAMGFWIEKGEKTFPVKDMAIAGNLLKLFSEVSSLGKDVRFLGSFGAPSMVVEGVDVSGGGEGL